MKLIDKTVKFDHYFNIKFSIQIQTIKFIMEFLHKQIVLLLDQLHGVFVL